MHQLNEVCFHYFAEIIRTLKSANTHEPVLSLVVDRIVRTFACQTCAVVLIDPKTEYLRIDHCHNLSLTFCNSFRRRIATEAVGSLLWTGKPIFIADASLEPDRAAQLQLEQPFRSCLCVQIAVNQQTWGYMHVDTTEAGTIAKEDADLLQMFADISGLALLKSRLLEENLRLDRIDRETGVEKYIPFLERLAASAERGQEFNESFAVLLLDIDNFKDTVNTYGYQTSRSLLKEMGSLIQKILRPVDAVGRSGFDEFIILLPNTGLEGAVEQAQRLRTELAAHLFTSQTLHSSVSLGVAAFPRNGTSAESVVLTAKNALFEAQRLGRNTVVSCKNAWHAESAATVPKTH